MSTLTDAQIVLIAELAVMTSIHPEALSDFERDLAADACRRFRDHGRCAVITATEWQPLLDAVAALRAAERAALRRSQFEAHSKVA